MYKNYKKQWYDTKGCNLYEEGGNEKYSPALYLKKHLTDEISRILTAALEHRTNHEKENEGQEV